MTVDACRDLIKALIKAGVLSEKVTMGYKDIPIFKLNPVFEKQAQLETDYQYEKVHGKPFKKTW